MAFLRRLLGTGGQPEVEITLREREREREWHEPFFDLGDLRGDVPPEALRLLGGQGGLDVVGEASYRPTIEAIAGGPRREGIRGTFWAVLAAEPDNPYDPNAISVRIAGQTVGYLPKSEAKVFRPVLDRISTAGRFAYCRADIRGGWNRGETDVGDYGVTIYAADAATQHQMLDHDLDGKPRVTAAEKAAKRPAMVDGRAKGPGTYRGRHHSEWHPEVARLRATGADAEAEELLLGLVDATEHEAAVEGFGVAPAAYETLALIYRKRKDLASEVAILERYQRQPHAPGGTQAKLADRLVKLRSK